MTKRCCSYLFLKRSIFILLRQMVRNRKLEFYYHERFFSLLLIQLQGDIGNRAPTYLKDLIGRLTTFSDEPRLAGLVGLVVTMVMDMAYMSSKRSSGVKGKSAGSSSCQVKLLLENKEEHLSK